MPKGFSARILEEAEYGAWDQLVELSPTGTAYQTSWWVGTMAQMMGAQIEIVGCFEGDRLCGGCTAYVRRWGSLRRVIFPPTTPYNGIVLRVPETPNYRRQLLHYLDVIDVLAGFMEARYAEMRLRHHFELTDVRALTWRGWSSSVNYTYVMRTDTFENVLARCSSSVKRAVGRARNAGVITETSDDLAAFLPLYAKTYQKQGLTIPLHFAGVETLFRAAQQHGAVTLYITREKDGSVLSGLVQLISGTQANTWLLGSDPERLREGVATCTQLHSFSHQMDRVHYVDDASANIENLHHNAVRLGGELRPVLGTQRTGSLALKARGGLRHLQRGLRRAVQR